MQSGQTGQSEGRVSLREPLGPYSEEARDRSGALDDGRHPLTDADTEAGQPILNLGAPGHLMNESMLGPQGRTCARGNVFSFMMPWQDT